MSSLDEQIKFVMSEKDKEDWSQRWNLLRAIQISLENYKTLVEELNNYKPNIEVTNGNFM